MVPFVCPANVAPAFAQHKSFAKASSSNQWWGWRCRAAQTSHKPAQRGFCRGLNLFRIPILFPGSQSLTAAFSFRCAKRRSGLCGNTAPPSFALLNGGGCSKLNGVENTCHDHDDLASARHRDGRSRLELYESRGVFVGRNQNHRRKLMDTNFNHAAASRDFSN